MDDLVILKRVRHTVQRRKRPESTRSVVRDQPDRMRIGVPSEVKDNEFRVALTPAGAHDLVAHGHDVLVQAGAGAGSSIPDEDYATAGASLVGDAAEVWGRPSCCSR